jgi:hypothetical protein
MKASGTAVKVVGTIVDSEGICVAVKGEAAFTDAVAVTAYEGAEERLRTVDAVIYVIVPLNDIGEVAVSVGHHNSDDGAAVIGDSNLGALFVFKNV